MNSRAFRKATIAERRSLLQQTIIESKSMTAADLEQALASSAVNSSQLQLSNQMVENAFGSLAVPLGLATGFLIDGQALDIPLATEEPSVIAAAGFMASLIARQGGFSTSAGSPIMTSSIYIEDAATHAMQTIQANRQNASRIPITAATAVFHFQQLVPSTPIIETRQFVDSQLRYSPLRAAGRFDGFEFSVKKAA